MSVTSVALNAGPVGTGGKLWLVDGVVAVGRAAVVGLGVGAGDAEDEHAATSIRRGSVKSKPAERCEARIGPLRGRVKARSARAHDMIADVL
jgi:hypothetical protein